MLPSNLDRPQTLDVAAFVGSLRRESYTRMLVRALAGLAPAALKIDIVDISQLGFYNQDEEAVPPVAWVELRARIRRADALLFATPEYNRSVPAVLKNVVDIGSRPLVSNAWAGKPGAIISLSPGAMGGFGANQHLRQSLTAVNVPMLPSPEAYIGNAAKLFDGDGQIANPATAEFLTKFLAAFETWIRRF